MAKTSVRAGDLGGFELGYEACGECAAGDALLLHGWGANRGAMGVFAAVLREVGGGDGAGGGGAGDGSGAADGSAYIKGNARARDGEAEQTDGKRSGGGAAQVSPDEPEIASRPERVSDGGAVGRCAGGKIYAVDLPGFGASSEPAQAMDFRGYAAVIAEFCRAKGIAPRIIVGHSFGCKVAAALAAQLATPLENPADASALFAPPVAQVSPDDRQNEGRPERLTPPKTPLLILAGAAGVPRPKPLAVRAKIALAKLLRGAKFARKMRAKDAANLSAVMYESFKIAVNDDARGSYKAAAERIAPAAHPAAPSVLILAGQSDTATPLDTQRELAALMKNSALVEFAGGHFFYADAANRERLAAVIKQFINER